MPSPISVLFNRFYHLDSLGLLICYTGHIYENKPVERVSVAICVRSCHIMPVLSACHPSEVGKMSTSLLGWLSHSCILRRSGDQSRIVPNSSGDCFSSTDALCRVWSPTGWMDGWISQPGKHPELRGHCSQARSWGIQNAFISQPHYHCFTAHHTLPCCHSLSLRLSSPCTWW